MSLFIQYIQQQIRADFTNIEAILDSPEGQDEGVWKYEHLRQFCMELNGLAVKLQVTYKSWTCYFSLQYQYKIKHTGDENKANDHNCENGFDVEPMDSPYWYCVDPENIHTSLLLILFNFLMQVGILTTWWSNTI